jgi:hypothetical protein
MVRIQTKRVASWSLDQQRADFALFAFGQLEVLLETRAIAIEVELINKGPQECLELLGAGRLSCPGKPLLVISRCGSSAEEPNQ